MPFSTWINRFLHSSHVTQCRRGARVSRYNSLADVQLLEMRTMLSGTPITDAHWNSVSGAQNVAFTAGVNSSPVVSGVGGTVIYVKSAAPLTVAPSLIVTDSVNINSATVSFTNWQDGDRIQFYNSFALQHTFVENLKANTATLTITGSATTAQYQSTLQSVQFWSVAGNLNGSTRVATFSVTDANSNSASGTQNVAVNPGVMSSPIVSGIGGTVTYVKSATPITVAPNLVVTDNVNIVSARVSFTNWQDGDRVQFYNSFALQHTFVEDIVAHTATMTITGSATAAQYRSTLQSVEFWSVAGNLNTSTRFATFSVTDINSKIASGTQYVAVSAGVSSTPVLSGIGGTVTYRKSAPPITVAPSLVITDSVNIISATVTFTNWQAGDRVQFLNSFALQHTFVENLGANTATLTVTGSATTAQYQSTLQSVQFWSVAGSLNSTTRLATITVTNANANSASGTQNVATSSP